MSFAVSAEKDQRIASLEAQVAALVGALRGEETHTLGCQSGAAREGATG